MSWTRLWKIPQFWQTIKNPNGNSWVQRKHWASIFTWTVDLWRILSELIKLLRFSTKTQSLRRCSIFCCHWSRCINLQVNNQWENQGLIRRGPKLEGCAFANFGNSSGARRNRTSRIWTPSFEIEATNSTYQLTASEALEAGFTWTWPALSWGVKAACKDLLALKLRLLIAHIS